MAGVMASLVRVYKTFDFKRISVIPDQVIDRFQNEVHLQRVADHVGQDLLGIGIQNGGEISEGSIT